MRIFVISRIFKKKDKETIQHFFNVLKSKNIRPLILSSYLNQIKDEILFDTSIEYIKENHCFTKEDKPEFIITLGGDGTILIASTYAACSQIPILGINLGRLGFLASVEKQYIDMAIDSLVSGSYKIENRVALKLESNYSLFPDAPIALNDFTILKRDSSSMITIKTYINGEFLNSFWADGLILSTPTGSTGYNLSCGGPIVFPGSGNFVLTPVSPHNLNIRPLVFSDKSVVSFEVTGRSDTFLCTLDSRYETITSSHEIAVKKNPNPIKLVKLMDNTFLNMLRAKLFWGYDKRD